MIYVLLPAYNEEDSLPPLLDRLDRTMREHRLEYQVIVLDDGSRDRTAAVLREYQASLPLHVIRHRYNRGLGETSRDLFEAAVEMGGPGDVLVRMDCDDTHHPRYIPPMLEKLAEGYDVVIASRFQPGGGQMGVDAYRAWLSRAANLIMRFCFPLKGVREFTCGFRAYRWETIKAALDLFGNDFIQLKGLGFTCTLEKLIKLNLLGCRFAEIPFVLRYDRKQSDSKMIGNVTMLGYGLLVLLYYWPWGGWRRGYRRLLAQRRSSARDETPPFQNTAP
jgi:dolichol-phosphate mannosyltransferase